MTEVVREDEIPCERVREGLIEVENLEKPISLDGVQIAVGESSYVSRALTDRRVLPETVAEDVTLAEDRDYLVVLNDLETSGHDEAERVYRLAGVVEKIPRRAVRHCEMHRQRSETTVGRQSKYKQTIENTL